MNIAFVPARGGSKSIPLKNIKPFCGRPLIYWSLQALQNSRLIDTIFVATDDSKIEKTVLDFGFEKVKIYKRDSVNATDEASTESVILEFLDKHEFKEEDILTLVQVTSPFTQATDFDKALEIMKDVKFDIPFIIQPETIGNSCELNIKGEMLLDLQRKALGSLNNVLVIPQAHKMLGVR